jgi:Beta-lactamase enzyme family
VTTARDLAHILYLIHAGAVGGSRDALSRLGLTRHQAAVALNLLLSSDLTLRDNVGLFRPWLDQYLPLAQKNGWLSDARHTAAILYTRTGPKILVLLTYRPDLSLLAAQHYGDAVLATVGAR